MMVNDANGIFEPMFGATAKEEYLDALEEQPSIDASGHIRFPEDELREKWGNLDRRSKMLLIERLIDELPETRRFLFAFAFDGRRWTGTVNRVGLGRSSSAWRRRVRGGPGPPSLPRPCWP